MSTFERVAELGETGYSPADIALLTGLKRETIHNYLSKARADGRNIGRYLANRVPMTTPQVRVGNFLLEELARHADARGMTPSELANRILETVVFERMIDTLMLPQPCSQKDQYDV